MLNIGDFARLGHVSPRMLRHYDELGLLRPDRVDPDTGYRSYGVAQLRRLHRLLALRDLGFGLDQIGKFLDDEPPLDELRGMLRLRQAQIEQGLAEEQDRLRRVEAHLRALERNEQMTTHDIVVKRTDPLRVAVADDTAPGFGHENISPSFDKVLPTVISYLEAEGAQPGICVAWYEGPDDDGSVTVHAGFDVGAQAVAGNDTVRIVDLPVVDVAAVVYTGAMQDIESAYERLIGWIDDSDYGLAGRSRELYLEFHEDDPDRNVTELQMPIARN